MAALKAFLAVAAVAVLVDLTAAANITVGKPGGSWDQNTNLQSWAQGQTFTVGDNLIFSYDSSSHDVLEVTKPNYDNCGTSSPIDTRTTGNDAFPLSKVGSRYFICGKPGHCTAGMKVEIDTVAASTPSPPGSSPSPPASTPGTTPSPPTVTSPPPPEKSAASSRGLQAKAAVGFGMLMLLAL